MNKHFVIAGLMLLASCGCSSKATKPAADSLGSTRHYNGTAAVGDFMQITLDGSAHTLTYRNFSNGDAGTVPYTLN